MSTDKAPKRGSNDAASERDLTAVRMGPEQIERQGKHPIQDFGPEPVCEQPPYPRYEPGIYEAECVAAEIYRDRQFGSWKCALRLSILADGSPVLCFLHLGSKKEPTAGARSEYRRAWIIASGEQPRKRQTLSKRAFVGKIFEVRIADVQKRHDGREHPKAAIYSVVKEIIRRTYP